MKMHTLKPAVFLILFAMQSLVAVPLPGQDRPVYLIIAANPYISSPALNTFINFRGIDYQVEVVTPGSIGTTAPDYRNFIRNRMPACVLLVGKYGDFPAYAVQYEDKFIETYNYYVASSLTGHPAPDIPLGLFFVENETELANIVFKTIGTETNISSMPMAYYAHAGSNEPLWPWPVTFNEELLTEMNTKYFAPAGYSFQLATANDSTPNDAQTDIQAINGGVKYVFYHGHGLIQKWMFGLGVGGLAQLHNTVYPFIFSFTCLTGSFSGVIDTITAECYARRMLASPHGASAFLGAYNTSGRGQNPLMEGLCNGLFNDSIHRIGDAIVHGLNSTQLPQTVIRYYPYMTEVERTRTAWQFHLFGDPALKINNNATSVNSLSKAEPFKIGPNPTTGQVNMTFPVKDDDFRVSVYNTTGQKVLCRDNVAALDLSDQPDGLYLVVVSNGGTLCKKKLIKKHE